MSSVPAEPDPSEPTGLRPLRRLLGLAAGWLAVYLAGPGILSREGESWLAPLGVMLWGLHASRPGRRAFLFEWLTATLAWAGTCSWAAWVWWGTLLYIGPGMGVYFAFTGWLLKHLARRVPLALAVPAAWVGTETLRAVLEPPFGFQWMRLGTHFNDAEWIAGSARVWGFGGLSFVLAASGGLLADLWRHLTTTPGARRGKLRWALLAGLAPLAIGATLKESVPAPETEAGPSVLLVQPGIPQERKMDPGDPTQLFRESRELTLRGIAEAEHAAEPAPDLVAWGETMLPVPIVDPELEEALRNGARPDPWTYFSIDEERLRFWGEIEANWVGEAIFGGSGSRGILPPGAAFVAGAEYLTAENGRVRRQNAVFLWTGPDERHGPVAKLHLVPGAETMLGLERFGGVRSAIHELAGYVPDLLEARPGRVLRFTARDRREFACGVSVCFDNAFDDPYTTVLREEDLDFHLILSNEAWFRSSQEADQMLAFSRLIAIQTGRAMVRATNSGISAVIDAEGREVARLVVHGRDREVRGTLRATIPVPRRRAAPPGIADPESLAGPARGVRAQESKWERTPFVLCEGWWIALWLALPALLLCFRPANGNPPRRGG